MHVSEAFDKLAAHPDVLSIVRRLVGAEISICGPGSAGVRDTPIESAPTRGEPWPVGGNGAVAPWGPEENGIMWQMWHVRTDLSQRVCCVFLTKTKNAIGVCTIAA